jgi:aryl-alcohol dehydrogenase-like predicted oxidoreductase
MEHVKITGIDTEATRVGLGTWAIGGWMWGSTEASDAEKTIRSAIDRGVTLIDTAPIYGKGRSEEIVGKAVADSGKREQLVIATKVGLDWDDGIQRDSSPARIRKEIEDSLRRLKTDVIDVYQVHWPDASVPFQKTAEELEKLRAEGKIRAIGTSNYDPEQMDAFREGAALTTLQPPYNLFERGMEQQHLPYCKKHGITIISYGALCRGLLSGKMNSDTTFPKGDLRRNDPKFQQPRFEQYLNTVQRIDALARERYNVSVLEFAVRWILDKGIDIALWGARRPDQLDPLENIWGWNIDADTMSDIDRILAEGIAEPVGPEFMAPPENTPL